MIREAFLPKKSHPATLAVVEHAKHWLGCAMHDPLAQPPAFSHLLHNQPPERQKQVAGSRSRGAYLGEVRWFVLVLGPFSARGASGIAQLLSSPSSGARVAAGYTLGGKGSSMEIRLDQKKRRHRVTR